MKYEYTHLIPENVAPKGATRIVVKSGNKEVCSIPASRFGDMAPPEGEPDYTFGLLSDTHICPLNANGAMISARMDAALTFFEKHGAQFVVNCGDLVNSGFIIDKAKGYDPSEFVEYKRLRDRHPNLPMYGTVGNHDSYNAHIMSLEYADGDESQTYEDELIEYTGHGVKFTVEHKGNLFIFIGNPKSSVLYIDGNTFSEVRWLESLLNNNRDKRCFVFMHPFLTDDSGNPLGKHKSPICPAAVIDSIIKNALKNHGRAMLFHGHAHFMPQLQERDKTTNYTDKNGFPSVHVPSLAMAARLDENDEMEKTDTEGYGYLVEVYPDCIYLRGRDFVRNEWVGIGTYRIEVTA